VNQIDGQLLRESIFFITGCGCIIRCIFFVAFFGDRTRFVGGGKAGIVLSVLTIEPWSLWTVTRLRFSLFVLYVTACSAFFQIASSRFSHSEFFVFNVARLPRKRRILYIHKLIRLHTLLVGFIFLCFPLSPLCTGWGSWPRNGSSLVLEGVRGEIYGCLCELIVFLIKKKTWEFFLLALFSRRSVRCPFGVCLL
jgi:hypothetical protein